MFNNLFYWLGGKGCAAFDAISEMINSEPVCSHPQVWNMGAVMFSAGILFVGYFLVRRRR